MSIYPHDPYSLWFRESGDYPEIRVFQSVQRPASFTDPKRILDRDRMIVTFLRDLENLTENLRQYRRDLAVRYNELSTMPYNLRLSCVRNRSFSTKRVTFTVTLSRILEDGTVIEEISEKYPGIERKQALARYENLKKTHPGIEASLDLEKAFWE